MILKRGHDLAQVLRVLEKKNIFGWSTPDQVSGQSADGRVRFISLR